MESNELLAKLANMESCLTNVDSARKQVQTTVAASSELQQKVREYVSTVKDLCASIQLWESDLKALDKSFSQEYQTAINRLSSACDEIITSFGTEADKAILSLNAKFDTIVNNLAEQNSNLVERVQALKIFEDEIKNALSEIQKVKESLNQISKELKDSQDNQDVVLEAIQQKVSNLTEVVSKGISGTSKEVSQTKQSLLDALGETNEKVDSINGKVDRLATKITSLTTLCQDIQSASVASTNRIMNAIENMKEEMTQSMNASKAAMLKSVNVNRALIVVGIIIIVILQIALK